MAKPEEVATTFACGPGLSGMDAIATEKDGTRIFIAGGEGMMKEFDLKTQNFVREIELDVDDTSDEGFAGTALAISPDGKELALGLVNGHVNLYDLPSLEFKSILVRFTAPVLDLDYGMGGEVIAACSSDAGIKVVRRSNISNTLVLDDHDGGVKSVVWDPKGKLLASAGFDGTVKVWDIDPTLDSDLCSEVASGSYFEKETMGAGGGGGQRDFKHLGRVSWHPEGTSLSITGDSDPLILARDSWSRMRMVPEKKGQGHLEQITLCKYSPNGKHLATAGLCGRIVVWDMETRQPVKIYVTEENDSWRNVQWLRDSDQGLVLAGITTGGELATMKDVIPSRHNAGRADKVAAKNVQASSSELSGDRGAEEAAASATVDNDTESRSIKNKRESSSDGAAGAPLEKSTSANNLFDEEAAEDDGPVSDTEMSPMNDGVGDVAAGLDGAAAGVAENDGDGTATMVGDGLEMMVPAPPSAMQVQPPIEITPLQDPFQPSSTPLGDSRRYLCWNRVGTIISVDENTHNAVEIEFADKSAGRNQRFMDSWNFVTGALSSTGAVFASIAEEENDDDFDAPPGGTRSVLYYKSLGRRSTGEDWTRKMPKGESIVGVATGKGWAAAATDRQLIRVFTASGLQGEIMMLSGPVVTMAGSGDLLMAVYHQGSPMGDSQKLGYLLLDVGGKRELSRGDVAISAAAELTWLGFTEEHMVVAMDSTGLLTGLTQSLGWRWTPLLDTLKVSKNKRDRFWPVGVVTGKLLAVTLKGGEEHPAAYPRPVLTAVPLSAVSSLSLDGEEMSKFEKIYPAMQARVRQRRLNLDNGFVDDEDVDQEELEGELMSQQAQLDAIVVKRIQEACAAEKSGRAMDLASLLSLEKSFHIAMKVANHHGLTQLAARMEDAMIRKFQAPEDDVDEGEDWAMTPHTSGNVSGGRARGGGGGSGGGDGGAVNNLGPLERARLMGMSSVPNRSSRPAGNRYPVAAEDTHDNITNGDAAGSDSDDSDSSRETREAGGQEDIQLVEAPLGGRGSTNAGAKRLRRMGKETEGDGELGTKDGAFSDAEFAEPGSEQGENEEMVGEAEVAPPAPRNPFARGGITFSSPPRKKRKDVLETMNDLRGSPSPVAKRPAREPALTRLSSFSAEARTKKRQDRNVL